MTEQHDAHCYILQETWQRAAKGKKRVQVMVPRKISRIQPLNGVPAIDLKTNGFRCQSLYVHEFVSGKFDIIRT